MGATANRTGVEKRIVGRHPWTDGKQATLINVV